MLVATAGGDPRGWSTDPLELLLELGVGALLGLGLPLLVEGVLRLPKIESVQSLRPLGPIAVAVLLYAACDLLNANQFLAAFVVGATLATLRSAVSESFQHAGELISELAKARRHPADPPPADPRRPRHLARAAAGGGVARPQGLRERGVRHGRRLERRSRGRQGVHNVAVAVLVSVLAHSTTDVAVAGCSARTRTGPAARGGWMSRPRASPQKVVSTVGCRTASTSESLRRCAPAW